MFFQFALLLGILFVNVYSFEISPVLLPDHTVEYEKDDGTTIFNLFDDAYPLLYNLKIDPNLETSTFKGTADISVFVKHPRYNLEFHCRDLTISNLKVQKGTKELKSDYYSGYHNDVVFISFHEALEGNAEILISIEFSGKLKDDMKGFYASYYEVNGVKKRLAVTSFKPASARAAFPCFDEPKFKAPFIISIARNVNQKTLSNMPLQETYDVKGKLWDVYEKSQPMATHQVAFMVSELSKTEDSGPVKIWAKENALQYTKYTLNQTNRLIKSLEDITGIQYELPKLDVVAVPDLRMGVIENFGMNIYREQYVLLDESQKSTLHKASATGALCYGLSHYWFGDLVTPTKWGYLWLNEGFATYLTYVASAKVEPKWNLEDLFVLEVEQPSLWGEMTHRTPMTTYISEYSQFNSMFEVINFEKAASVIRMLEHIISTESFKKIIPLYLIKGRENEGHVTPQTFFDILENQVKSDSIDLPTHITISDVMTSWTENIGYPLITVKRDLKAKKVQFHQTTYQSPKSPHPTPKQRWIVPLTCATKSQPLFSNTKPSLWSLSSTDVEFPKKVNDDEWILCNLQHAGYYRVNYDNHNWNLLIEQLRENTDVIPPLNRAQLINDAFTLAHDSKISYSIPIRLAYLLENDTNVIPWIPAAFHLDILYSRFADTPYQLEFYLFIRNIIYRNVLDRIDFEVKETESVLMKVARMKIYGLLCKLNLPTCTTPAMEMYGKHYKNLAQIDPDWKPIVYCTMLNSNETSTSLYEWNELWSLYKKTENQYDKNTILTAFGCAKSETPIVKTLAQLNDGIRKQDRKHLINALSYSSTSVRAALRFIKQKIAASAYRTDDNTNFVLKSILSTIGPWVQTETQMKLLREIETQLNELVKSDPTYQDLAKYAREITRIASERLKTINSQAYNLAKIITQVKGTAPPQFLHDSSSSSLSGIENLGVNIYPLVYVITIFIILISLLSFVCLRKTF